MGNGVWRHVAHPAEWEFNLGERNHLLYSLHFATATGAFPGCFLPSGAILATFLALVDGVVVIMD